MAEWRGVYARHRLDISVGDMYFGVFSCGLRLRREKLEAGILRLCSLEEEGRLFLGAEWVGLVALCAGPTGWG